MGVVYMILMFSHSGTMPACDRQTDRRKHYDSRYHVGIALCGKYDAILKIRST